MQSDVFRWVTDLDDLSSVRVELQRLVRFREHWSESDSARYTKMTDCEERLLSSRERAS